MTNEEALEQFHKFTGITNGTKLMELYGDAVYAAGAALEKQIPKKPVKKERTIAHEMEWDEVRYEKQIVFHCPCCKGIVSKEYPKKQYFCNSCGQRINLEESEES